MLKRNAHKNTLWGMAIAAVLLFVATAAMPVAALEWPSNNNTFITPANGMRSYNGNFSYNGNGSYYFMMLNGTQGMNAIHITNSPSAPYGTIYNSQPTSGSLYVSSTGGHTGEDAALLLIGISSPTSSDLTRFGITLNVSGYNWAPLAGAAAPTFTNQSDYNARYYNSSSLSKKFTASDYLKVSTTDVTQKWKFAPLNNYPMFGGQDMTVNQNFKLILVDLNAGVISTSSGFNSQLHDQGMVNVTYRITSSPSSAANITFNTYVFNRDAPQAKGTVHWLNAVNVSGQTGSTYSGWKVTP
jgi:hypothetical protein